MKLPPSPGLKFDNVINSGSLAASILSSKNIKYPNYVYVCGGAGIFSELSLKGIPVIDSNQFTIDDEKSVLTNADKSISVSLEQISSVLMGFDIDFNYKKLLTCQRLLRRNPNVSFIVTNRDAALTKNVCHSIKQFYPGTGCWIAAVVTAAGREPDIVCGKPNQSIWDYLKERDNINEEETVVIGDR